VGEVALHDGVEAFAGLRGGARVQLDADDLAGAGALEQGAVVPAAAAEVEDAEPARVDELEKRRLCVAEVARLRQGGGGGCPPGSSNVAGSVPAGSSRRTAVAPWYEYMTGTPTASASRVLVASVALGTGAGVASALVSALPPVWGRRNSS